MCCGDESEGLCVWREYWYIYIYYRERIGRKKVLQLDPCPSTICSVDFSYVVRFECHEGLADRDHVCFRNWHISDTKIILHRIFTVAHSLASRYKNCMQGEDYTWLYSLISLWELKKDVINILYIKKGIPRRSQKLSVSSKNLPFCFWPNNINKWALSFIHKNRIFYRFPHFDYHLYFLKYINQFLSLGFVFYWYANIF